MNSIMLQETHEYNTRSFFYRISNLYDGLKVWSSLGYVAQDRGGLKDDNGKLKYSSTCNKELFGLVFVPEKDPKKRDCQGERKEASVT